MKTYSSFDVFLCHNSEDKPAVKEIGERLKEEGLRPWLDEWELRPGVAWQRSLEEQIEHIHSAVIFVGPSGIGPWQQMEVEAYLREFVERRCPVIPVILPGVKHKPDLPVFIKGLTWVDFRLEVPDPLNRLIWGITGEKRGSRIDYISVYRKRLEQYFKRWSKTYTDLRLTTDIRVASYQGKRSSDEHRNRKWWFRELLGRGSGSSLGERIVVLGDPGSGKTTACQRAAWELSQIQPTDGEDEPPVPIYIGMATYESKSRQWNDLSRYKRVIQVLGTEVGVLLLASPESPNFNSDIFENSLRQRPFVFFFDGLNEVHVDYRVEMFADLFHFIETFKGVGHIFVLTTRRLDYEYDLWRVLSSENPHIVEILELDSNGMSEFVMRDLGDITAAYSLVDKLPTSEQALAKAALDKVKTWEEAFADDPLTLLRRLFARLDPEGHVIARIESATELLSLLRKTEYARVLWLAQNPSTLKDVIDVYRARGDIPHNRILLFEHAIRARLRREEAKRTSVYTESEKLDVFQAVAVGMQGLIISRDEATEIVKGILPLDRDSARSADGLLLDLISRDGILIESSPTTYSFVKQPYQEYFVARGLRERWRKSMAKGKDPIKDSWIKSYFENPLWLQTTASMAGLLESSEVEELVWRLWRKRPTRRLASLCVRHASELSDSIIEEFKRTTIRRILRYTLLPEQMLNIATSILYITFIFALYISVPMHDWLFTTFSPTIGLRAGEVPLVQLSVWGAITVGSYLLVRVTHVLEETTRRERVIDLLLAVIGVGGPLIVGTAVVQGSLGAATITASAISLIVLLFRVAAIVIGPVSAWLGTKLEDRLVIKGLIPNLEVLRDMGPEATNLIIETQERLARNRFVSQRIKDVIDRTWALSPRTVLQVLEEIDLPERQAEGVRVLGSAILRTDISSQLREDATGALLRIAEYSRQTGAVLGSIEALLRLAQEQFDYHDSVVLLMKRLTRGSQFPVVVRRRAWRAARELGVTLSWPQVLIERLAIVVMIIIGIFIFLYLWSIT